MATISLRGLAASLTLSTALLANPTLATPIPDQGLTLEQVAKWLQSEGYRAEIVAKDGKRHINSATEGVSFSIFLDDCLTDGQCQSIQFDAGFDLKDGLTLARANEWNRTKRWAWISLDEENDPFLDMCVSLAPGSSFEALEDSLGVWSMMVVEAKTFIGW